MSRIGKQPVAVPSGVTANLNGAEFSVKGPKGELSLTLMEEVTVELEDANIKVAPRDMTKRCRSMWGMQRTMLKNLIDGVTEGFTKELELKGTGYRAQMQGNSLKLMLGLSHDVIFEAPAGVEMKCPSQTEIVLSGIDKQKVGQAAAKIRSFRPPEPYKGKGVRYKDEYVFMKEGKKK